MPPQIYTSNIANAGFSCHHQSQATPIVSSGLEPHFSVSALESQSMQLDAFVDDNSQVHSAATGSSALNYLALTFIKLLILIQLGEFWGADLQSVAQIGFGQNQETAFSSQSFHGKSIRRLKVHYTKKILQYLRLYVIDYSLTQDKRMQII